MRVVITSGDRIDMHLLRELLGGGKDVRLATEEELDERLPRVRAGRGAARRAASRIPCSSTAGSRSCETVVLEAGVHDQSIRIEVGDLIRVTGAQVVDVVES